MCVCVLSWKVSSGLIFSVILSLLQVQRVVGDGPVTTESLGRMDYLQCVLKEALRLRPSVPLRTRDLSEDTLILGRKFPKDTTIGFSPYVLHNDPDIWPSPEVFDPSRFEEDENGICKSSLGCKLEPELRKYAHAGFGAGPRRCIGEPLSLLEAKAVLAHLILHYKFSVRRLCPCLGLCVLTQLLIC